jgi:hypothetical protein
MGLHAMNVINLRRAVLAAVLAGSIAVPAAATEIASRFSVDNEGWQVVAYPFHSSTVGVPTMSALPYDAVSGNPAGSVRVGDIYGETGIAAPAAFLGDKGAFYGGIMSWDILIRYSDNVTYPALVLFGATMTLYYDAAPPIVDQWTHMSAPLTEAGWKVGGSQVAATQADLQAVLHTLSGVYIYTEWHSGPDDTNVDNIVMSGGASPVGGTPAAQIALRSYPNPFNPQCTVRFELPAAGHARLAIFDVAGRHVRTLVDADLAAGEAQAQWDGRDAAGTAVGSGSYLARLESGGEVAMSRLVLVR